MEHRFGHFNHSIRLRHSCLEALEHQQKPLGRNTRSWENRRFLTSCHFQLLMFPCASPSIHFPHQPSISRLAAASDWRQAVRADFRWHSHMLKLMELQLANPRRCDRDSWTSARSARDSWTLASDERRGCGDGGGSCWSQVEYYERSDRYGHDMSESRGHVRPCVIWTRLKRFKDHDLCAKLGPKPVKRP